MYVLLPGPVDLYHLYQQLLSQREQTATNCGPDVSLYPSMLSFDEYKSCWKDVLRKKNFWKQACMLYYKKNSKFSYFSCLLIVHEMNKLIIFAILVGVAYCTQTCVTPSADSYLSNDNPTTNYGSTSDGWMGQDYSQLLPTGDYFDIVTMFDISSLPSTIIAANVIYKQQWVVLDEILGPYLTFNVKEIATNWTESAVTWNNPPVTLSTIINNHQDYDTESVIFPVTTSYNNAKTASRTSISFRVYSAYSAVPVYMKEASIQYRPLLCVDY